MKFKAMAFIKQVLILKHIFCWHFLLRIFKSKFLLGASIIKFLLMLFVKEAEIYSQPSQISNMELSFVNYIPKKLDVLRCLAVL